MRILNPAAYRITPREIATGDRVAMLYATATGAANLGVVVDVMPNITWNRIACVQWDNGERSHVRYDDLRRPAITRENVNALLDAGAIETLMTNGRWWRIRRNGRTQTWKRDANRVRIPFKVGLYEYGAITETDFIDTDTVRQ